MDPPASAPADPGALRILMLSCMFLPEVYGGAEQQCLRQAAALQARGHRVTILSARTRRETAAREHMQDVAVVRLGCWRPPDLLGRWSLFSLFWLLRALCFAWRRRGGFDLLHCHQGKFGLFAGACIALVLGVPQLVKIGNSAPDMDLEALRRKKLLGPLLLRHALARRPAFAAISSWIARDLLAFGVPAADIRLIPNCVSIPLQPRLRPPDAAQTQLFWHGRMEPIKNLEMLLRAFALAQAGLPGLRLHLLGSGSQAARLRTLASELGIGPLVRFHAASPRVLETVSRFDVYVNTSLAEGMSNSMLEALALGKCLVSAPVSGAEEIIDDGINGFIAPEASAVAMARAICAGVRLYRGEARQVFQHNLRKARTDFSAEAVAVRLEQLYAELLARRRPVAAEPAWRSGVGMAAPPPQSRAGAPLSENQRAHQGPEP